MAEGQIKLAEGQAKLVEGQAKLTVEMRRLGARLDGFARAVIRGFTNGAGRHFALSARVDRLERRVATLERRRRK